MFEDTLVKVTNSQKAPTIFSERLFFKILLINKGRCEYNTGKAIPTTTLDRIAKK